LSGKRLSGNVIVRETSVIPARMKRTKLLLQKFLQSATDFYFTDEKVFSDASPDNRQNKVSGRLRELLKKKLSGRRLDVCHTSTYGVALVRI